MASGNNFHENLFELYYIQDHAATQSTENAEEASNRNLESTENDVQDEVGNIHPDGKIIKATKEQLFGASQRKSNVSSIDDVD